MTYPEIPDFHELIEKITEYSKLKHEFGAENIEPWLKKAEADLHRTLNQIKNLPVDSFLAAQEPDGYAEIKKLRPDGPRRLWTRLEPAVFREKLEGALLARAAGCTLGAPVEIWEVKKMADWAKYVGDQFPPVDYWSMIPNPFDLRYQKDPFMAYTRNQLRCVPVDDDIAYTILGLLVMEDFGPNFTTDEVGQAWLKYLPYAATAEEAALRNLKSGVPAREAAELNNPYCQWIGADIRSDPWAYMAPGCPEKAAALAYRDAYLSHRRNGIYGAMFFSAAQSAAFAVDHPLEAIQIGMTEIPRSSSLYKAVEWALEAGREIKDYQDARQAVDEHFQGMNIIHTNINACLTIFGLIIGGTDVTKVISETVAMGLDNDCTAATAGSIVGAIAGKKGVPEYWYKNFNNTVNSYLINHDHFRIDDLMNRFYQQAQRVFDKYDS